MERMFQDEYLQAWAEENPAEAKVLKKKMAMCVRFYHANTTAPTASPISGVQGMPYTPTMPAPGQDYYFETTTNSIKPIVRRNGSGALTVTEASGSAISSYTRYTGKSVVAMGRATIAGADYSLYDTPQNPKIGRKVVTLAGGAAADQELVAALAGYYGVCKITGITSSVTAANGLIAFESPAATPALPGVTFDNAYTANRRNTDLAGLVVTHATLTDNQAIVADLSAFGAGAGTVIIEYEYWYET